MWSGLAEEIQSLLDGPKIVPECVYDYHIPKIVIDVSPRKFYLVDDGGGYGVTKTFDVRIFGMEKVVVESYNDGKAILPTRIVCPGDIYRIKADLEVK